MKEKTFSLSSVLVVLALVFSSFAIRAQSGIVDVQILAVNDFHGNLQPPSGSSGRIGTTVAGGAGFLATHINNLRALNPNTIFVSAGDLIGASPLLSALFHDEPTIEAFNIMGLDLNAVGNHEFDEGAAELKRMAEGGCHPVDGCLDGDGFAGANFQFLAANVFRQQNDKTLFPAYKVKTFAGAQIAFIGMTLKGTPAIVTPSGVAGLNFEDEAATVNALVPELKSKGIHAIVVLIHEGGAQAAPPAGVTPEMQINRCDGISGPIVDIVNHFDPEVDVVISAHTHNAYNCTINGKLVTSASSFGRLVTKIDLSIDRSTGDVVNMAADNRIVTRDVPADLFINNLIAKYDAIAAPLANRIVGSITSDITRAANGAGESALGDVIADAQLYATAPVVFGQAVVAFMNPGGIRADLIYKSSSFGNVTYGEIFAVQPFGNSLVTMDLTGQQIHDLLVQQFAGCLGQNTNRILQVSIGFSYTWRSSAVSCDEKVDINLIKINGVSVNAADTYRVTVNSFLADGGDNFRVLVGGIHRLGGAIDLDALQAYFAAFSPVAPGPQNRITQGP